MVDESLVMVHELLVEVDESSFVVYFVFLGVVVDACY